MNTAILTLMYEYSVILTLLYEHNVIVTLMYEYSEILTLYLLTMYKFIEILTYV